MLIKLKNKEYLIVDEFRFKCSIGKNGLKHKKRKEINVLQKAFLKLAKFTIDLTELINQKLGYP